MAGGAAVAFLIASGGTGVVTLTITGAKEAMVLLDGEEKGTANPSLTLKDVSAGSHDIIVQQSGFEAFSRTINVEAKRTVNLPLGE